MSSNRASLNFSKPYSIYQNINILPTVDSRLRVLAVNKQLVCLCFFVFLLWGSRVIYENTFIEIVLYTKGN